MAEFFVTLVTVKTRTLFYTHRKSARTCNNCKRNRNRKEYTTCYHRRASMVISSLIHRQRNPALNKRIIQARITVDKVEQVRTGVQKHLNSAAENQSQFYIH